VPIVTVFLNGEIWENDEKIYQIWGEKDAKIRDFLTL
jgi:hypothetical protein